MGRSSSSPRPARRSERVWLLTPEQAQEELTTWGRRPTGSAPSGSPRSALRSRDDPLPAPRPAGDRRDRPAWANEILHHAGLSPYALTKGLPRDEEIGRLRMRSTPSSRAGSSSASRARTTRRPTASTTSSASPATSAGRRSRRSTSRSTRSTTARPARRRAHPQGPPALSAAALETLADGDDVAVRVGEVGGLVAQPRSERGLSALAPASRRAPLRLADVVDADRQVRGGHVARRARPARPPPSRRSRPAGTRPASRRPEARARRTRRATGDGAPSRMLGGRSRTPGRRPRRREPGACANSTPGASTRSCFLDLHRVPMGFNLDATAAEVPESSPRDGADSTTRGQCLTRPLLRSHRRSTVTVNTLHERPATVSPILSTTAPSPYRRPRRHAAQLRRLRESRSRACGSTSLPRCRRWRGCRHRQSARKPPDEVDVASAGHQSSSRCGIVRTPTPSRAASGGRGTQASWAKVGSAGH